MKVTTLLKIFLICFYLWQQTQQTSYPENFYSKKPKHCNGLTIWSQIVEHCRAYTLRPGHIATVLPYETKQLTRLSKGCARHQRQSYQERLQEQNEEQKSAKKINDTRSSTFQNKKKQLLFSFPIPLFTVSTPSNKIQLEPIPFLFGKHEERRRDTK